MPTTKSRKPRRYHRNADGSPAYRLHRGSGQAIVTINGQEHYLGKWQSPSSHERYAAMIRQWRLAGKAAPNGFATIADVMLAYRTHALDYYKQPSGRMSPEVEHIGNAARLLRGLYASTPAVEFSPLKLQAVRDAMVAKGWSRMYINSQVKRLRRIFAERMLATIAWACSTDSRGHRAVRDEIASVALSDCREDLWNACVATTVAEKNQHGIAMNRVGTVSSIPISAYGVPCDAAAALQYAKLATGLLPEEWNRRNAERPGGPHYHYASGDFLSCHIIELLQQANIAAGRVMTTANNTPWSALCDKLEMDTATLNKYAKACGVPTPCVGERDFALRHSDTVALVHHVSRAAATRRHRDRAGIVSGELANQKEVGM